MSWEHEEFWASFAGFQKFEAFQLQPTQSVMLGLNNQLIVRSSGKHQPPQPTLAQLPLDSYRGDPSTFISPSNWMKLLAMGWGATIYHEQVNNLVCTNFLHFPWTVGNNCSWTSEGIRSLELAHLKYIKGKHSGCAWLNSDEVVLPWHKSHCQRTEELTSYWHDLEVMPRSESTKRCVLQAIQALNLLFMGSSKPNGWNQ